MQKLLKQQKEQKSGKVLKDGKEVKEKVKGDKEVKEKAKGEKVIFEGLVEEQEKKKRGRKKGQVIKKGGKKKNKGKAFACEFFLSYLVSLSVE